MPGRDFKTRFLKRAQRAGVKLLPQQIDQLEKYYDLLARWNPRVNLTALALQPLTDSAVDRLLIEPLVAAKLIPDSPSDWMDLGSGGGSPALPLKIVRPDLRLVMVEARSRKAAFLREAIRVLNLQSAAVENVRFEELANRSLDPPQLVTVRALRPDKMLIDAVTRLLGPGGLLLLFHSARTTLPALPGFQIQQTIASGPGDDAARVTALRRIGQPI